MKINIHIKINLSKTNNLLKVVLKKYKNKKTSKQDLINNRIVKL
jgi:hypothetical protein